jgi:pseudouridine-5'-phosphate glycosidase
MLLASLAGIRVFVTGGLGGVHRGASETWDVSADVTELARTSVCVVCAGAKSILDIPKTLEVLETGGVAVCAFGADSFPAFYTRESGVKAPWRLDTARDVAAAWHASLQLGLGGGMVVAVPVPAQHEADGAPIEAATQTALREAEAAGLQGNAITPFLLKRVTELTGGASLDTNIELVLNNARVGTQVGECLGARLRALHASDSRPTHPRTAVELARLTRARAAEAS